MPNRPFHAMPKAPTSQPVRKPREPVRLLGLMLLVGVFACGDPYQHTNPYDPAVDVTLTITGPDTLFSAFETATYAVEATPAFPDTALRWSAGADVAFGHIATFVAPPPPLWPATSAQTVSVMVGQIDTLKSTAANGPIVPTQWWRHAAQKTVIITQRITHLRLRCPDVSACDTLSVGGTWTVFADALDALGQPLYIPPGTGGNAGGGAPEAIFVVRDTTVARATTGTRASAVTALSPGSTWIVATRARDALLDSLQLVVH